MHHGLVTQAGQKLSKSVGGYQSLPDMVSKHEPAALRLLTLQTHYRKPIDLSQAIVAEAERSWKRLVDAYWRFSSAHPGGDGETIKTEWRDRVVAAMDEDMNTAGALAAIYDLVRAGHSALDDGGRTGPLWAAEFSDLARAIGLDVTAARATGGDEDSSDAVEALLAERVSARAERDFARADAIRTQLANDGIVIEDTPAGTTWYRA